MSRIVAQPEYRQIIESRAVGSREMVPLGPQARRIDRAESPLTQLFPGYDVYPAGFHQIAVPGNLNIPTGMQAWYGLRRWRVDEDTGQEITLIGAELELWPCDVDADGITGVSNATGWGDARGMSAAIVVHRNLPIEEGGWTAAPAHIAGIQAGTAQPPEHTKLLTRSATHYNICKHFPPGKWGDTQVAQRSIVLSRVPYVQRFPVGSTLDVALVIRREHVHNLGATKTIVGLADIRLIVGLTQHDSGFSQ